MPVKFSRIVTSLVVVLLLLTMPRSSNADVGYASDSKAAGVIAGVVGAVAVIGVVAYFALRTPRTSGCTVSTPGGLQLQADSAEQGVYSLNDPSGLLKPGEHVRVLGKRKGAKGNREITVVRVAKNFGACSASQPSPSH